MTASASSSSATSSREPREQHGPRRVLLEPPPLLASWLDGADLELLAPLRFVGSATMPAPGPRRPPAAELVSALERANRAYGHPVAGELAVRLADPATAVVVAGQQPGLFGGPLYTLLKAVAAGLWAQRLEASGQPAVPLFWVATEDHDWDEVARAGVWAGGGLRRLTLGPDPAPLVPMGMRTLGPGVSASLEELATVRPGPAADDWLERLGRWYRPDARFGEAFCRLLVDLMGESAPLLVDALLPELKAAQAPWLRRLVERRHQVADALTHAESEITARGYPLQVSPQPGAAPLFLLQGQERRRVLWAGAGGFSLRGSEGGGAGVETLLEALADNPSTVGPNVLSRPPVQDAVLGTSVQVMGPGEICYLAQAAPLYRLLDVPPPAVALRPQALILEARQAQLLEELELPTEALLEPQDALDRRLAERQGADFVAPAAAAIGDLLDQLQVPATDLDPSLERPWHKTRETVRHALERFGDKVARAAAGRDQGSHRRLETLREYCRPEGVLHERVLSVADFRSRFGSGLAEAIWEQLSLDPSALQVLIAPDPPEAGL